MRVLVGVRCLIRPKTGIGHHTLELVRALKRMRGGPSLGVFPQPGILQAMWAWHEFAPALKRGICDLAAKFKKTQPAPASATDTFNPSPSFQESHRPAPASREDLEESTRKKRAPYLFRQGAAAARSFYHYFRDRAFLHGKYDLYHEPNYFPIESDLPTIVTVHDLSAILHPEWHPDFRVKMHEVLVDQLVPGKCHFLTVSQFVKKQMIDLLGVDRSRVHVCCNGVREHLKPLGAPTVAAELRKLGLPSDYFLHVGTIEPRKNLDLLLRAWEDLPLSVRSKHPLVLAGGIGWKEKQIISRIDSLKSKGLIHLGYVADRDLPALYGGALGLVFPSHDEGFGMPPVEMLACGGAVISAPAGAVEEVTAPAAHILRSTEVADWRRTMYRLATDYEWRQSLKSHSVQTAAQFTWDRCAHETFAAYRKLLEPVQSPRTSKAA